MTGQIVGMDRRPDPNAPIFSFNELLYMLATLMFAYNLPRVSIKLHDCNKIKAEKWHYSVSDHVLNIQTEQQIKPSAEQTLQALYDSEINFRIECFWDAGFNWSLGTEYAGFETCGTENTYAEAVSALAAAAVDRYPRSKFAKGLS